MFLIVLLLFQSTIILCQKKIELTLNFPKTWNEKKVLVLFDNGSATKPISQTLIKDSIIIQKEFMSTYGLLAILYYNANDSIEFNKSYFVKEGKSGISITLNDTSSINNRYNIALKNVFENKSIPFNRHFDQYVQKEYDDINNFNKRYSDKIDKNDSLQKKSQKLDSIYVVKSLKFLRQYPKNLNSLLILFYSLRYYKYPPNLFLDFIYKTFYPSFKNYFETNFLIDFFRAKTLTLNSSAPNFKAKDINGNVIQLQDFNGSFVLLDFWATWCKPCVAELPTLRDIRKRYSEKDLKIIAVSFDTTMDALKKGIDKYQLNNWIHIYNDINLRNKYQTQLGGLPMLYLINPEGKIILNTPNIGNLKMLIQESTK